MGCFLQLAVLLSVGLVLGEDDGSQLLDQTLNDIVKFLEDDDFRSLSVSGVSDVVARKKRSSGLNGFGSNGFGCNGLNGAGCNGFGGSGGFGSNGFAGHGGNNYVGNYLGFGINRPTGNTQFHPQFQQQHPQFQNQLQHPQVLQYKPQNFIQSFRPGKVVIEKNNIVQNYNTQGNYQKALRYFYAIPLVKVAAVNNANGNGFQGSFQKRRSYSVSVCQRCQNGQPRIEVRCNTKPYNYLVRRFVFHPQINNVNYNNFNQGQQQHPVDVQYQPRSDFNNGFHGNGFQGGFNDGGHVVYTNGGSGGHGFNNNNNNHINQANFAPGHY